MIKGCIFDLDGVIVDTAKYHYQAWKKLADHLHIPFSESQNEAMKGISRKASLEYLLNLKNIRLTEEEKDEFCKIKNDWYLELVNQMDYDEILPGVKAFLSCLKELNIKIGLGSASKNAKTILKKISLTAEFDEIVDGNDVINSKPDPEVFIKGAARLEIQPREVIVFEDSAKGIEAAIAGGFRTVGIGEVENLQMAEIVIPSFENVTPEIIFQQMEHANSQESDKLIGVNSNL